jgi:hypothetical protein
LLDPYVWFATGTGGFIQRTRADNNEADYLVVFMFTIDKTQRLSSVQNLTPGSLKPLPGYRQINPRAGITAGIRAPNGKTPNADCFLGTGIHAPGRQSFLNAAAWGTLHTWYVSCMRELMQANGKRGKL